jgi:hypothetical protein
MESRMRGNSHVRFGVGDEETYPGNGARRFIPTLLEIPSALSLLWVSASPTERHQSRGIPANIKLRINEHRRSGQLRFDLRMTRMQVRLIL